MTPLNDAVGGRRSLQTVATILYKQRIVNQNGAGLSTTTRPEHHTLPSRKQDRSQTATQLKRP
jgi:hypothetical protein